MKGWLIGERGRLTEILSDIGIDYDRKAVKLVMQDGRQMAEIKNVTVTDEQMEKLNPYWGELIWGLK
jgi:hypothetical protein